MPLNDDTVVAPATAPGVGAIAIVRMSGPLALKLLKRFFHPIGRGRGVKSFQHRRLVLGDFVAPGDREPIDQVMAAVMRSPHSYTGEDVVEVYCHGSPAIVLEIVEALCHAGARLAQPGEFTRRAFENGRLDLTQAEAICDVVQSATSAASRMALRQLAGQLLQSIGGVRAWLIDFAAEVEARLDFPEDDIEPADQRRLDELLAQAESALAELVRQGRRGRVLREGARIVLVGRPNVGKSALLNALVGRERAIVSPHPGTTRDTIECTLDLEGIAVTVVDTAGWRASGDEIERKGVERTENEIAVADLIIWVVDRSEPLTDEDRAIAKRLLARPTVVACNKSDLPAALDSATIQSLGFDADRVVSVCALRSEGVADLERRVVAVLFGEEQLC
ncbi:tRNA uridine-5-carboxymethylaminomethyl(34) synthesis GTPase MnmE, partial [Candidatus Sumerlaeota bacterium]|nr:tRNA uridine-5-carboxymethylaminomethyl(34) synthesis GTPase MnmE [Candidatus Sumerlaeota bacterium]